MRVPGFEIARELGRGGMGVVYEARDASGRRVAIKAILPGRADVEALARFAREQRLQGELGEAEGFIPLLAAGTVEGTPYLVMPLLAGGTLRARLGRGPLSVSEALALGRALAAALGRAHARGVVHRDMKPENVLFSDDGRPLIADLGLARLLESREASITKTRDAFGTTGYAPPEQLEDAKAVTPAADVFALGAILYECLAGAPPYPVESLVRYIERLRGGRFVPLRRVRPDVPAALAAAIERALAPDARQRPADALSFERALVVAADERRRARRRVALAAVSVAALVLVAATGAFLHRAAPPPPPPPPPPGLVSPSRAPIAELALEAVAAGRLTESLHLIVASLALDPPTALRAYAVARVGFATQHDLDGVKGALATCLALEPRQADALGLRALVALEDHDAGAAERDAAAALAIDAACLPARIARVQLRRVHRDGAGALAEANELVRRAPRCVDALEMRCHVLADLGDDDGSLADAKTMLELWPDDPSVALTAAEAYFRTGALRDADALFTRTLAARPGDARALRGRGHARFALGEIAAGYVDARAAADADPSDPDAWTLVGVSGALLGHDAEADAAFERAITLDPRSPEGYLARARVLVARNDARRALADAERALAVDPSCAVDALAWRATAKYALGDREGALADAEESIRRAGPGDRRRMSYIVRAKVREDTGDFAGAIADYEKVLDGAVEEHSKAGARARIEALRGR